MFDKELVIGSLQNIQRAIRTITERAAPLS